MGCAVGTSQANRVRVAETEVASLRKKLQDTELENSQLQRRLLEASGRDGGGATASASTPSKGRDEAPAAEETAPAPVDTPANAEVQSPTVQSPVPLPDGKAAEIKLGMEGAGPPSDTVIMTGSTAEMKLGIESAGPLADAVIMTGSTVASNAVLNEQDLEASTREQTEVLQILPGTVETQQPLQHEDEAAVPDKGAAEAEASLPLLEDPERAQESTTTQAEEEAREAEEERQVLMEAGNFKEDAEKGTESLQQFTPPAAPPKASRDMSSTVGASTLAETTSESGQSASASQAVNTAAPAHACIQCGTSGERLFLDSTDMNRYCQKCWIEFYGEPPCSSGSTTSTNRLQHLVTVDIAEYWLDDQLAQLWVEHQLPGWPPHVQPLTVPAATEPEVWSSVIVRVRRDVVGPHARETIHGDRPYPGEVLASKYRVGRSVGEGHFTKAFLATDLTSGASVCLKRHRNLSVEALADLMVLGRRMDEVDLGGRLFPKMMDAFYDLVGYTVESLVEGRNCLAVMQRDRTFFHNLANLGVVAHGGLNGLMHLDRAGVVHNDVKPDNIIWVQAPTHHGVPVEAPTVQIVDYGCARLDQREDSGRNWSLAEGGAGHLGKWSPEMALRLPITHHGDVWGIAVTLCELHCGRFVWHTEADTAEVVLAQALGLCGLRDGIPSSLLRRSPLDIRLLYTPAPVHLPIRRSPLGQMEALRPRQYGLEQVLGEGWRENGKAALGELLQGALVIDPAQRPSAGRLLESYPFAAPPETPVRDSEA